MLATRSVGATRPAAGAGLPRPARQPRAPPPPFYPKTCQLASPLVCPLPPPPAGGTIRSGQPSVGSGQRSILSAGPGPWPRGWAGCPVQAGSCRPGPLPCPPRASAFGYRPRNQASPVHGQAPIQRTGHPEGWNPHIRRTRSPVSDAHSCQMRLPCLPSPSPLRPPPTLWCNIHTYQRAACLAAGARPRPRCQSMNWSIWCTVIEAGDCCTQRKEMFTSLR